MGKGKRGRSQRQQAERRFDSIAAKITAERLEAAFGRIVKVQAGDWVDGELSDDFEVMWAALVLAVYGTAPSDFSAEEIDDLRPLTEPGAEGDVVIFARSVVGAGADAVRGWSRSLAALAVEGPEAPAAVGG